MGSNIDSLTVIEQISEIANNQLAPGYFRKYTAAGDAETAMRERIDRDDRELLVCYSGETITEVDDPKVLSQTDKLLGFGLFGTYTAEEMDEYMSVPLEEVFSHEDFPVGHFRNLTLRAEAQGGSITSPMISRVIEGLYELGQDVWVMLLRNRQGRDTTDYVEDFGAERVEEYDDYLDDWNCAICESDCECTFVFYRMEVT
ncbi:hypothetical protein [Natrialba taiwanensis]|uniref:N-acetyltransferase domain-containing protein n=1 Tax=Natrialba taiwanensis DSM 12281 TaxID=1230458 RepID=L9ZIQ6_9EURY|nr:hypothetical protein [Natrialba taiwanensis]ELY86254.1 hypothetical protein C484_18597 [Natrialba taiwanensis DSM 12281]